MVFLKWVIGTLSTLRRAIRLYGREIVPPDVVAEFRNLLAQIRRAAPTHSEDDDPRDAWTPQEVKQLLDRLKRLCMGKEQFEAYARRIEQHLPEFGKVHLVAITDKQYESIIRYIGRARQSSARNPAQLALF